ncbi:substrate-binding periplasmic protein [Maridesulfovibrio salexigens]|uniref:Solute-binding protein family 3/N-terminal domain-containing protein n=1 Tax=Maridesulfovibrio salexigens (strain ATCC 14822 / DSM 2638 / NCIMB 8403 / VKM B-1763) TaxID=526222 RepID=C6C129_MARSD|nr:hypothetical protein [Maridesulfovibrio salexigens]ACS79192.1 hypothetical protein Desal_1129 [Maridesulfovibrio salexigens DSM 2638]
MFKYVLSAFFLVMSLLMVGVLPSFAKHKTLTLVTHKPITNPDGLYLNLVYTEVFNRLGIILNYKVYPAKRCELLLDAGEVDGDFSRIYSYGDSKPDLIRVEEPHWESGFIAVAMKPNIELDGWSSLNGTGYRTVYRRGIKGCEVNLPRYVKRRKLDKVASISSGFQKLIRSWADVYIGAEMDVMSALDSDEFRDSGLKIVGVMDKFTAHLYLHKKNKHLAPKVAAILRSMKAEGLLDKYKEQAGLKSYIESR